MRDGGHVVDAGRFVHQKVRAVRHPASPLYTHEPAVHLLTASTDADGSRDIARFAAVSTIGEAHARMIWGSSASAGHARPRLGKDGAISLPLSYNAQPANVKHLDHLRVKWTIMSWQASRQICGDTVRTREAAHESLVDTIVDKLVDTCMMIVDAILMPSFCWSC